MQTISSDYSQETRTGALPKTAAIGQAMPIAPDVWEIRKPLRLLGLDLGVRMTISRLSAASGGGLLLHSPVRLSAETRETLANLGTVRYIVAPNTMHHLFVGPYFGAYPNARVYAAPGLQSKRPELAFHEVLGDRAPAEWAQDFEQLIFAGTRKIFNEVVFFHKATRTLIVTDLVFNVTRPRTAWEKGYLSLMGLKTSAPGVSRLVRLMIADRKAARRSLETLLSWQPERLVMAHGEVVRSGATQALQNAFSWL